MNDKEKILQILSEIDNSYKRMSKGLTDFSLILLDSGWFFDYSIPLNYQFQQIAADDKIIFNLYMKKYFSDRIDTIEQLANERFPKRKNILQKAIKSHKNGDYELSIPVLIGQIDGIFREITSKELYSNKQSVKAENILKEIEGEKFKEFYSWVLEPLRKTDLINANFKESRNNPDLVHRNPILHGEDVDYVSEEKSLKCISLLNYVVKVVYDLYKSIDMAELANYIKEDFRKNE